MRWLLGFILVLMIVTGVMGQGSKVTFRDDHAILVDNKPFFPIGLYYCYEEFDDQTGKQLKELHDYGFNTLGYYRWGTPNWKAELKRANDLGFKVWIRGVNGLASPNAGIDKAIQDQVRQLRNNPALLFWEFEDEPILNKVVVEEARKGYQLVKREDPYHPILVVEWPGAVDRWHLWKGLGDIHGTDLYPIPRELKYGQLPNHDITQMRDYIEAMKKARGDVPILMVLQAWAWKPLVHGEKGYPTPHESRFMAYQAVIHGAKGIHYYGQYHCTKPNSASALYSEAKDPAAQKAEFDKCLKLNREFWNQQRGFFKELNEASKIFVLRNAQPMEKISLIAQTPKGERGIEILTKQGEKSWYLLAVNGDKEERKATFRLPPGVKAAEIQVLFEGRKLPVKEGVFEDEFKAYDTHVYSMTPELPR